VLTAHKNSGSTKNIDGFAEALIRISPHIFSGYSDSSGHIPLGSSGYTLLDAEGFESWGG
jgi:hypothetical protein